MATAPALSNIKVGDPATFTVWTDAYPCTVVAVRGKSVFVTFDSATLVSGSEHDGSAVYSYETVPDAPLKRFSLRKNGRLVQEGQSAKTPGGTLAVGVRRRYVDPSF